MTRRFATDLRNKDDVDQVFKVVLCVPGDYVKAGQKKLRLDLTLQDRSGQIAAVQWDPTEREITYARQIVYARVCGQVKYFKDKPQITLNQPLQRVDLETGLADYEWSPSEPIDEMRTRLDDLIASVQEPTLKRLLDLVFQNPKTRENFELAPAAFKVHHAFPHGLLQHTLEVAEFADAISRLAAKQRGSDVSRDLAVTAALVHDIGKIQEFEWKDDGCSQTRLGQLIGHINLGYTRIAACISKIPEMPSELKEALLHMILSHHGKREFGSPVTPMFPEALIVSMADDLSAKLHLMTKLQQEAMDTDFVRTSYFDSGSVYVGSRGVSVIVTEQEVTTPTVSLKEEPQLQPELVSMPQSRLPIYSFATKDPGGQETLSFKTRSIAFYGAVAAGFPRDASGEPLEWFPIQSENLNAADNFFLLEIDGESMTGDGLNPGDKVLVRKQESAENGDIVIAWFADDRANVKHFHKSPSGEVTLLSSNPKFPPISVPDPSAIQIHGKVIGVMQA